MNLEEIAKQKINTLLEVAGWKMQDVHDLMLGASLRSFVKEIADNFESDLEQFSSIQKG